MSGKYIYIMGLVILWAGGTSYNKSKCYLPSNIKVDITKKINNHLSQNMGTEIIMVYGHRNYYGIVYNYFLSQ